MKQVLLFITAALLCTKTFAQGEAPVQAELNTIFQYINKSQIPNGYLGEYGSDFAEKRLYNGVLADSNFIYNISGFNFLYNDIVSARIYSAAPTMPSMQTVNDTLNALPAANASSLVFLTAKYGVLKENALSLGLFTRSGNQLFDVAGRPQSPYTSQQLFAAAPADPVSKNIGAIQLTWRAGLCFSNSGQSISQVWIDFLDGAGYRSLPANTVLTQNYTDSSGYKKFNIKVQCSDLSVLYSSSRQYVQVPVASGGAMSRYTTLSSAELNNPAYTAHSSTAQFSDGKVYIRYSQKRAGTALANKIVKPLIVVEGYDIHDATPALAEENYDINNLINEWNDMYIEQLYDFNGQLDDVAGYDLIFVDYYTMDAIPSNARMLENVLNWVNTQKVNNAIGIREQNVVMGISMGGLVSRYCLAQMTKESKVTDTRLLLTQDSPHQGANVPLGTQHFLYDFGAMKLAGFEIGKQSKQLKEFYLLNQQPATASQLIIRVTDANGNRSVNSFLAAGGPYRLMVDFTPAQLAATPPSYQFKAVSQGSQCAQYVMPTNTTMIDYSDKIAKMQILFGITVSSRYKLTVKIKALPNQGSSNTISYSKMERNIRFFFGIVGTGWKTTFENTRLSPANTIPWDCVPGSTQSFSGRNGSFGDNSLEPSINSSNTFFGNVWRTIIFPLIHLRTDFTVPYLQDLFSFVPITSSLDIANVDISSFNSTRIFPINGLAGSRAVNYIAQQKFTNTISGQSVNFYNLNHTNFTARNSEWMFNEMENLTNNIGCTEVSDCYSPTINVSYERTACNEATVTAGPNGSSYTWTVTGDLLINGTATTLTTTGNSINITGTQGHIAVSTSYACGITATGGINYLPFQREIAGLYPEYMNNDHVSVSVNTTLEDNYYRWYINNTLVKEGEFASYYCTCYYEGPSGIVCGDGNKIRVEVDTDCETTISEEISFFWICGYGKMAANVEIYPNPAKDQVNIKLKEMYIKENNTGLKDIKEVKVFDKFGNLKRTSKYNGHKTITLNITGLIPDIYFVEVNDGKNSARIQLIIKN